MSAVISDAVREKFFATQVVLVYCVGTPTERNRASIAFQRVLSDRYGEGSYKVRYDLLTLHRFEQHTQNCNGEKLPEKLASLKTLVIRIPANKPSNSARVQALEEWLENREIPFQKITLKRLKPQGS